MGTGAIKYELDQYMLSPEYKELQATARVAGARNVAIEINEFFRELCDRNELNTEDTIKKFAECLNDMEYDDMNELATQMLLMMVEVSDIAANQKGNSPK